MLLVLGFFTCGFQLAFITAHLPAYLVDRGLSVQVGGWGAVLGDEGGAAGLVREAARAVWAAHDRGEAPDALAEAPPADAPGGPMLDLTGWRAPGSGQPL